MMTHAMFVWGITIYVVVGLIAYFGPPFYPKLYHWLRDIFSGDAPFVPYIAMVFFWPVLVPVYLVGFGVFFTCLGVGQLGVLQDRILNWSEERELAKQNKQLYEIRRREKHADKYL